MRSNVTAIGGGAILALGFLLSPLGGCGGGGRYRALCEESCDKVAACVPESSTTASEVRELCKENCAADRESHCTNDSARASAAEGCLAMDCEGLLACGSSIPPCQQGSEGSGNSTDGDRVGSMGSGGSMGGGDSIGSGGSLGSGDSIGSGGSMGGGDSIGSGGAMASGGAMGSGGTGGSTGTGATTGTGSTTGTGGATTGSCGICTNADTCCLDLRQRPVECGLGSLAAMCEAATGAEQASQIAACEAVIRFGTRLPDPPSGCL